jgi:hypothetical protein
MSGFRYPLILGREVPILCGVSGLSYPLIFCSSPFLRTCASYAAQEVSPALRPPKPDLRPAQAAPRKRRVANLLVRSGGNGPRPGESGCKVPQDVLDHVAAMQVAGSA